MIINEKFRKPIISFGLGKNYKECAVGDTIKIYQLVTFVNDVPLSIDAKIPITTINKNEFSVTPTTTGVFEITISNASTKSISNILTLEVI